MIVLDTNVIVAGIMNDEGPPGQIVDGVLQGRITLAVNEAVLAEYWEVLPRAKFAFDPVRITAIAESIEKWGVSVPTQRLAAGLPDPEDDPFLEVALAAGAECLVTGNLKHFPPRLRQGVTVLTPAQFIERLRAGRG